MLRMMRFNRKAVIMTVLAPISICLGGLALLFGLQESRLPFAVQVDELRLLDPSIPQKLEIAGESVAISAEDQVKLISDCRDRAEIKCGHLLTHLLQSYPADGRIWLEFARVSAAENGLDEVSTAALERSYTLSPLESWIARPRTRFALAVWPGLPAGLKDIAQANITGQLDDPSFLSFLANLYRTNPLTRQPLSTIVAGATAQQQRAFLDLIKTEISG